MDILNEIFSLVMITLDDAKYSLHMLPSIENENWLLFEYDRRWLIFDWQ